MAQRSQRLLQSRQPGHPYPDAKQRYGAELQQRAGRLFWPGFGLHGKLGEEGEIGINYGLIHSRIKNRSAGKITGLPGQTLTAWLSVSPGRKWRLTLSEEARSASYSDSAGQQKAAGFALTHLRLTFSPGYGWRFNAAVANLLDKKYALTEGFFESGRQYRAGAEYRF